MSILLPSMTRRGCYCQRICSTTTVSKESLNAISMPGWMTSRLLVLHNVPMSRTQQHATKHD